uniref:hypothetical protein n=1 Tax=Thiohalocapsa sp. TaxID=2497641 RepID=UPI0025D6D31C
MPTVAILLLPAALLLLVACAQPPDGAGSERPGLAAEPSPEDAGADPGIPAGLPSEPDVDLRMPPRWLPAEELVIGPPAADAGDGLDPGASSMPEGDPALRQAVAGRCGSRPAGVTEGSLLRALIAELQADGVDPAHATDALILGRCGDLADIVTEMVAQNGADAAVPVIDRALAIAGGGAALVVERAAAEGLLRAGRDRVGSAGGMGPVLAGGTGDYAMVYFPLGGAAASATERGASSLAELVGNAEPGYGIYTYILHGDDAVADAGDAAHLATYRELLRVIETYVLVAGPDAGGPDLRAHTFLVPVHAGRAGAPLTDRTGPDLSAAMRLKLAEHLRRVGQSALAARLATAPGPFLVSSLEPRLVPGSQLAPRMIVDLSGIGPEYMYSIVDAYDRTIPPDTAGRVESLL